jgi:hypothetical protein
MKKLAIKICIFFFIGIWFGLPLSAAIGDGPAGGAFGSGAESGETLDTYVPIDGGIVTVTGLAIGYGLKQRRKRRNQKYNP